LPPEGFLPFGEDWVAQFIRRHAELRTIFCRIVDMLCIQNVTWENITTWFEESTAVLAEKVITISNIYNIDKTGFGLETSKGGKVIVNTMLKTQIKGQLGYQE
jgi:hypothetical protein